MSDYQKGWKRATREAAKKAGHYDGRFANKTFTDRKKEHKKYKCREDVENPENTSPIENHSKEPENLEGLPKEWTDLEDFSYNPFADLLQKD